MATNWQSLQSSSADDKAAWYNQQLSSGQSDAQIRAAVTAGLGAQTSSDWSYLQNLAAKSYSPPAPAPAPISAPPPAPSYAPTYVEPTYTTPAYTPAPAPAPAYAAPAATSFNLSSLSTATPQAKADWYSQQRASGQSDAQIRAAVTNGLGSQTDTDWQYLQGLAGSQSAMTSAPTQDQGAFFNGLVQNINSTDWQALQSGTPQQKADWYSSLSANRGLSDGAIRAIAEKSVGKQSDADWAALQKLAGVDNPTPMSYMAKLPSLQKSTENAINAALLYVMQRNAANGYGNESSGTVNTLRGYYSDDPQLKANAIQAAENLARAAGYNNVSLTGDYGVSGIRGLEDLDIQAPEFSNAFDPTWNRPTLYDQINSSMGWSANSNLYADPKNRDAALNRKLTDDEIRAFQDGKLTPELAALAAKYGAGNKEAEIGQLRAAGNGFSQPSAGGMLGGASGGTPASPTGIGGQQGSFSASGAPSTGLNLSQLQGASQWSVRPNQTVQAQLQQILAADSPLMQQARTRALQTANSRGLLNSTMSQSAADSAMYDAAYPIAAADAGLYGEAARYNADTSNTFSRDGNAFTRDAFMADFNLAANEWAKQQDQVRTLSTMDYESRLTLERDAIQNGYASAQAAIANGYAIDSDTRKFNWQSNENALTRTTEEAARVANGAVTPARQVELDAAKQAEARAQINKARQDLTTRLLGIEEAGNLSTEAKDKMIDDVVDGYQTIVQAHIAESGWTGASADVWNYKSA